MVSPPRNPSVVPSSDEAAQTDSASWLKDRGSYRPRLSKRLEQARVGELSRDRDEIKMQSRNSDWDQPPPVKISNGETGSPGQRISASVADPSAREELRRFLASSDHESSIEERIRNLERENVQMLLEVWRLKLEFARAKRELRSELFRLKMEIFSLSLNYKKHFAQFSS